MSCYSDDNNGSHLGCDVYCQLVLKLVLKVIMTKLKAYKSINIKAINVEDT